MNTYYIVRHGHEHPTVTGATGRYVSESAAERQAWSLLGMGDDEFTIGYTQVIKVTDGQEELVNEFEY